MALLHWYIIPIGIEVQFNTNVLQTFALFVDAVEFAMTIKPCSIADLKKLSDMITEFLKQYEKTYVGSNPEKISRARLCIFQLIHVLQHIKWHGSIRLGSQATVERNIGVEERLIRSKKAPLPTWQIIFFSVSLLSFYVFVILSLIEWKPQKKGRATQAECVQELEAICNCLNAEELQLEVADLKYKRWGKGNQQDFKDGLKPMWKVIHIWEALAFYQLEAPIQSIVVVYHPLTDIEDM
ncbi:hypothetical protein BD779DRAFT_1685809 [Infundibulicybe gibba]|nr:hypothetical protein BD779DRAFT_1685809 [Infundibulicybe gibba]